jgi:ATP-dependent Clp endopeptidase proteolytic subunit ClpP
MRDTRYRFHGNAKPVRRSTLENRVPENAGSKQVATLRLYDPIDSWGGDWGVSAKEFTEALDALDPKTKEIRLHLNTPGGEVFEAVTILNALRRHDARVVAVIDGLAASAGSFLAAGADETLMGRNSQLMIHDAWGLCVGNATDMRDLATRLDQLSDNIADIYAAKAGGSTMQWREAMLAETWYSADEAVKAGLADDVEGEAQADPENAFDLSVFQHAGRSDAPDPTPLTPTVNATCKCGPNNGPALPGCEHKQECPEDATESPVSAEQAPEGMSAWSERHHRLVARKHGLSA